MEVMKRSGLASALSKALRPVLVLLFPTAGRDPRLSTRCRRTSRPNLLGLGNAATPAGIRAASRLKAGGKLPDVAGDELCRLVVLNSASIQLIPATVCAVRAAAGSAAPFDILPAVWLTSLTSLSAGLSAAFILGRLYGRRS
jgi:spore maturation protein A